MSQHTHHLVAVADDLEEASVETDPLLVRPAARTFTSVTPLPKLQLAAVFAIKLVIPVSMAQVMPYINVLVAELAKSDGAETGYYSGLVVSARSTRRHAICVHTSCGRVAGQRQWDCTSARHIRVGTSFRCMVLSP